MRKLAVGVLAFSTFAFAGTNHPALDTILYLLMDKGVITPEEAQEYAKELRRDMAERNREIESMINKAIEQMRKAIEQKSQ
jgi:polyhydroxyalkanoate synthesis regulator phasin